MSLGVIITVGACLVVDAVAIILAVNHKKKKNKMGVGMMPTTQQRQGMMPTTQQQQGMRVQQPMMLQPIQQQEVPAWQQH